MQKKTKTPKSILKNLIDFSVIALSLSSFIFTLFFTDKVGYELYFLHPLAYVILYFTCLRSVILNSKSIFAISFSCVALLRYVILPILVVYASFYGGRSMVEPSAQTYNVAIIIMFIELFIYSIIISLLWRKKRDHVFSNNILPRNTVVYTIFIIVTLVLTAIFPSLLGMISFINPSISGSEHMTFVQTTSAGIVLYFIFISKYLIFLLLLTFLYKKYLKNGNRIYYYISLVILFLNLLTYYGLNRMDLVLPAIISLLIFSLLYQQFSIGHVVIFGGVILLLITIIGEARELASFANSFYNIDNVWVDRADFVQCYVGGVYNVAIALEVPDIFPQAASIERLLYDIFRPFIGINIFLKDVDIEFTNAFFNKRLWHNDFSSQIMPMVGQGYIHLGPFFCYLLGASVIVLAKWLEGIMLRIGRLETNFFIGICLLRMGFFMGQNTSNIINEISMNLILFSMVFYLNNKLFKFR